ncbi:MULTISPECIES: TadE/TadG family type IV pilus assembly protein [unclassified Leisingera]|uniref:TadE/TadG family type IV pilus assembly protein n=1 Tax=unclassified Leisingera TaxID=2614906 RepID=UPI000318B57B|nr:MULTISPECIES: TadE/TadG family type IV pilus assembly protein [unclassified Leisingera]
MLTFLSRRLPGRTPRPLRKFAEDTQGNVALEFAVYAPLLLGLFAAVYTFFDAFRQESINLKAAYTISDLISRETNYVNETYIDSMHMLAGELVRADSQFSTRISVVRWDEDDQRYYVDWSKVRGSAFSEWDDGSISNVEAHLPTMPDQERVILVETWNEVDPVFNVGLPKLDVQNFVFTRPRFAPQVVFVEDKGNGNNHNDDAEKVSPPA